MSRWWLWLLLLPIIPGVGLTPIADAAEPPVFLGLYPGGDGGLNANVGQIQEVDTWLATPGRRFTIGGTFMGLDFPNPGFNVPHELDAAWNNGYVPFVNLSTVASLTSAQIANGSVDAAISTWAGHFATWAKGGGGRRAFLAPLPEMNGRWVPYGPQNGPPTDFIAAYRHIRALFAAALQAKGVTHNAISWVFVPNGGSEAGDEFEHFYPGHDDVDVVAFSGYNYGGCPGTEPWWIWETFDTAFKPFLDRMIVMAPGKPIFIAQTGVVDKPAHGVGDKDEWFRDTFARLAAYPRLRGIVYFNYVLTNQSNLPLCNPVDFRLRIPGTSQWQGFKDAATNPSSNFGYWAPTSPEMSQIVFAPTPDRIFNDVFPIHPFAAEPGEVDFSSWIHTLYNSGITQGCSVNPPLFCPGGSVTRAQMAVFLLKGIHGAGYVPPPASGNVFSDVPSSNGFAPWIERLAAENITGGCGGTSYCPNNVVTRGQMAVFLLKARHGGGYVPPPVSGHPFADAVGHPLENWIVQLAAEGITGGCGGPNYCPNSGVTREQMAVFLVRAFGL